MEEGFVFNTDPSITVKWWFDTEFLLEQLNIDVELEPDADWQVIKKLLFADLVWDYEEGLKWDVKPESMFSFMNYIKGVMETLKLPYVYKLGGVGTINALEFYPQHLDDSNWEKEYGLIKHPEFDFIWLIKDK